MADPRRKIIPQPFTPVVQMYINRTDILRSGSGKPRSLVSFTHDIYMGTGGFWTAEIFDPDYVFVENLLVSSAEKVVISAPQRYGQSSEVEDTETVNVSTVAFRYGYAGPDQIITMPDYSTNQYFFGTVHAYVPRFETNGTYLTIRGDSAGARIRQRPLVFTNYAAMDNLAQIFESVCLQMDWTIKAIGDLSWEELKAALTEVPAPVLSVDDSAVHTQPEFPQQNMRENEDPLTFLNRLCLYARSEKKELNNLFCRLEYRATISGDGARSSESGVLYFGAESYARTPIREYVYMRDPKSDVISFEPNVQVWVAALSGASGMVVTTDDIRKGYTGLFSLDEINRELPTHLEERLGGQTSAVTSKPGTGIFQRGRDHTPDVDAPEGQGAGKQRHAPAVAPDQDAPGMNMVVPNYDEYEGDIEVLNYFLSIQNMVNQATLQVVGDPDELITPGQVIWVSIYVPDGAGGMLEHWTSNFWIIVGVNHEIRGGQMITNLELVRQGMNQGGVESKADSVGKQSQGKPGQQERAE